MNECQECGDSIEKDDGELCDRCHKDKKREEGFKAFAIEEGLSHYPRPDGERYLYGVSGSMCKKGEYTGFIDELWDVLVSARGRKDLRLRGAVDDE